MSDFEGMSFENLPEALVVGVQSEKLDYWSIPHNVAGILVIVSIFMMEVCFKIMEDRHEKVPGSAGGRGT